MAQGRKFPLSPLYSPDPTAQQPVRGTFSGIALKAQNLIV
jgi:hypothetical protein